MSYTTFLLRTVKRPLLFAAALSFVAGLSAAEPRQALKVDVAAIDRKRVLKAQDS